VRTPATFGALLNTRFDWAFRTVPQSELNHRQIGWPRGRGIGGTNSINYMMYVRGNPADFDHWRQLGCTGWGWEDVLPYFRKSEGNRIRSGPLHGADGPLTVCHHHAHHPLSEMFLEACQQRGIPFNDDLNGERQEGCGYFPVTMRNNERLSSAAAYLHPALARPNLSVLTGAHALGVQVQGGRALGVRYLCRGETRLARAEREVVLAAGAVGSPHLLLLSGIGPADELEAAGVEVVHDLPGVGRNLQDHFHYRSRMEITAPLTVYGRTAEEWARVRRQYEEERTGPLTTNHLEAGAFVSTRAGLMAPDLEIVFIPYFISYAAAEFAPPDRHGITISGFPTRAESRGSIRLASADPLDRPLIDPRYLSEPGDMRLMLELIGRSRDIWQAPAFDAVRGRETSPGPDKVSEPDLIADIRQNSSTSFHPVGTCRMGIDDVAVVDPSLRVRGLESLRIADASVMPQMITGHPNAATIMIGEKAADLIAM
jgi:choline dehydrogenase